MKKILILLLSAMVFSCTTPVKKSNQYLLEELQIKESIIKHLEKDLKEKVLVKARSYAEYYDRMQTVNRIFDSCVGSDKPINLSLLHTEISAALGVYAQELKMDGILKDTGLLRKNNLRHIQCQVLLEFANSYESYVIRCFPKEPTDAHIIPVSYKIKQGEEYIGLITTASYYGIYEGKVSIDSVFRNEKRITVKSVYNLKNSYTGRLTLKPDKPGLYRYVGRWECNTPEGPKPVRIESSFIVE